jgi:hypothetical protein
MDQQSTRPLPQASIIQRIADAYSLGEVAIGQPQKGYRNSSYCLTLPGGELRNLIVYKHEPGMLERVKRADAVSDFAAKSGLPTRVTLGKIIKLSSPMRERYAALYTYLPGETIAWEAYTQKHLKLLGISMAKLHAALQPYLHTGDLPQVTDEYRAICGRMQAYFSDQRIARAVWQKLGVQIDVHFIGHYSQILDDCDALPGQQALHMDFVRGNVLFENQGNEPRISGILDFEKTGRGHPLLDLARTYAFLLVDCKYKDTEKVKKYFLQSGYSKYGQGRLENKTYPLFLYLVHLFLTYDFYKFLRHNPYESLYQNEHFIRTKDILIKDKLLIE